VVCDKAFTKESFDEDWATKSVHWSENDGLLLGECDPRKW